MKAREWTIETEKCEIQGLIRYGISGDGLNYGETVHVIEKSAFDRLLAEADKLAEFAKQVTYRNDMDQLLITGLYGEAAMRLEMWQAFKKEMGLDNE